MKFAGVDIGSSSVKGCLFAWDEGAPFPAQVKQTTQECGLARPRPDWVEHPLVPMERALRAVVDTLPPGTEVGLASAMHGLVLLDRRGEPICDAISWADQRSARQAEQLRSEDPEAHQRTGTPLHPMAWPAKLAWVKQQRPEWWARLARVTDLKSYLMERLVGQTACPIDRSSASGTGLWGVDGWDRKLCRSLELDPEFLPEVDEPQARWKGFVLGGADGPLSNLGVGAVGPGRVAVSLGTSGAVRRWQPAFKGVRPELFLYALLGSSYVEGGALSNGSSVLDWLSARERRSPSEILELAGGCRPGAGGLLVYPYFSGERAPFWRPGVRSRIVGWGFEHGFPELARACLEGVAFCLRRLLHLVAAGGEEPLRCTGGMFASPVFCQLLADVSGRCVACSPVAQATALGAGLLTLPEPLELARSMPPGRLVHPSEQQHRFYQEIYQEWLSLDGV